MGEEIEEDEMVGPCGTHRGKEIAYWVLWWNFQERDSLEDPSRGGRVNIEMGPKEVGWDGVDLNSPGLGQAQVAGCCECANEPSSAMKCREFLDK